MTNSPKKLLTFSSGGWVLLLAIFFTGIAAFLVLLPVYQTGFRHAIGDGVHPDTYGFDLSRLAIPAAKLIASGQPKDGIRAIPAKLVETISPAEVDLIAKNEHIRFLVPDDRVIGIQFNGVTRAYPVRVLAVHEVVNDTLADGFPLCITYSPLCDSIVLFDRRIDGPNAPPAEFGVSGLLVNSNLVLFDRRSNPAQESLWTQLSLAAISGPKVGQRFTLIPYELTTWSDWRARHPDTRVLLGLRTLKREYGSEPYNTYFADDTLRFPVDPLWSDPARPKKSRIIATSPDGLRWTASRAPTVGALTPATAKSDPYRIHAFLFAWYAFHQADTQY